MIAIGKTISFYFLLNVWKFSGFFWENAFKIWKQVLHDIKKFSYKINMGNQKNSEFNADSKFFELGLKNVL